MEVEGEAVVKRRARAAAAASAARISRALLSWANREFLVAAVVDADVGDEAFAGVVVVNGGCHSEWEFDAKARACELATDAQVGARDAGGGFCSERGGSWSCTVI